MSERSQCVFEKPDDILTTHDARTKSGPTTPCRHVGPHRIVPVFTYQYGQALLSTDQSRRLHFLPFLSLNTRPSVSQTHAKGYPSFLSSPLFFPFKAGRMFGTGCLAPRILERTHRPLYRPTYSGHTATYKPIQRSLTAIYIPYSPAAGTPPNKHFSPCSKALSVSVTGPVCVCVCVMMFTCTEFLLCLQQPTKC